MARRKPRALLEEPKRIQSGCRAQQIARNRWRAFRIKQRCAACVLLHMAPARPPLSRATMSMMSSSPPPYREEELQQYRNPSRGVSEVFGAAAAAETTMPNSRKCFDHRTHAQWRWRRRQRRPSEVDEGAPCGCRSSSKEEAECDCCQLAVATARRVATPPPDYSTSISTSSSEHLCHPEHPTQDHDSAISIQHSTSATEGLSYSSTSASPITHLGRVQGASLSSASSSERLKQQRSLPQHRLRNGSNVRESKQLHRTDVVRIADQAQQREPVELTGKTTAATSSKLASAGAEAATSSSRTTARRRNSPSAGRAVPSSSDCLTRPPNVSTPPQYSDQRNCQYSVDNHHADHNFHQNSAREGTSKPKNCRATNSRVAVARGEEVKSEVDLSPLYHPRFPCDSLCVVGGAADLGVGGGGCGGGGGSGGISGGSCCSGGGGALPPRSLLPPGAQTEATLVSATRDQRQRRGGRRAILSQRSRSESDDEGGFCIREVVLTDTDRISGHQIAAPPTNATDPTFYVEEATAGEEESPSTHRPRSTLARLNAGWSSVNRHCRRQNLPPRRARNSAQRVPSDAQGCLDGALPPYASPRRAARAGLSLHYPPPLARPGRFLDSEIETPKHCCAFLVNQTISIRWFILMIAFVGLSCSLVGTVLGTFRTGREHLTIALLMIGVGIVLITVSGVAWRLTAYDSVSSCGTMLGLTTDPHAEPNRRFVNRMPPYGRYNHPYAAMMYPEFHYRPPPPTYQASMQEYRLRLLFDRHQNTTTTAAVGPVSPPPTYRSAQSTLEHTRPHLNQVIVEDYSRPPSYRSRASSSHGGPASMLRSCLGDVARSTDTLATTPPSEIVPNPLASTAEIEKSPRGTTGTSDNGTEKDTSARGSDVVKVYVNFAQE